MLKSAQEKSQDFEDRNDVFIVGYHVNYGWETVDRDGGSEEPFSFLSEDNDKWVKVCLYELFPKYFDPATWRLIVVDHSLGSWSYQVERIVKMSAKQWNEEWIARVDVTKGDRDRNRQRFEVSATT